MWLFDCNCCAIPISEVMSLAKMLSRRAGRLSSAQDEVLGRFVVKYQCPGRDPIRANLGLRGRLAMILSSRLQSDRGIGGSACGQQVPPLHVRPPAKDAGGKERGRCGRDDRKVREEARARHPASRPRLAPQMGEPFDKLRAGSGAPSTQSNKTHSSQTKG